jgi:hypothetical protein
MGTREEEHHSIVAIEKLERGSSNGAAVGEHRCSGLGQARGTRSTEGAGPGGYTGRVCVRWVRKNIVFWQKRSPKCGFMDLPPYPPS